MADGIAGFVENLTGKHSSRSQAKDQVPGSEIGAGSNCRRKLVVLVIGRCNEAAFSCLQGVLAWIDLELKAPILGRDQRLDVPPVSGVGDEDASSRERVSACRADDCSCNPVTAVRRLRSSGAELCAAEIAGKQDKQGTGRQNRKGIELQKPGHLHSLLEINRSCKCSVFPAATTDSLSFRIISPHGFGIPVLEFGLLALESEHKINSRRHGR